MDIQVGDRVTFDVKGEKGIKIITSTTDLETFLYNYKYGVEKGEMSIIKIERSKYEEVEEKKELLTDEEREFLKLYIKFSNVVINGIKREYSILNFMQNYNDFNYIEINSGFENLKNGKLYTLSELGLENSLWN